ncbi:MAG TPA: hypothetical protein VH092_25510, partial [Urbifossiella sp.]|nr:hypothetical protein [Urbifossiella sp.]
QDAVRSLRATWTTRTTTPKGALSDLPRRPGSTLPAVFPTSDTVHDGTAELLLDGEQVRITTRGMRLDGEKGEYHRSRIDSVFDGKRYTRLSGPEIMGHATATTKTTDHNGDGEDMAISPVFAAVRGRVPILARVNLDGYTRARRVVSSGRALVELIQPRDETRGEAKLWVDPAQEFSLVAKESYDRLGSLVAKATIVNSLAPAAPPPGSRNGGRVPCGTRPGSSSGRSRSSH